MARYIIVAHGCVAASLLCLLAIRAPRSAVSVAPGQPGNLRREMGEGLSLAGK